MRSEISTIYVAGVTSRAVAGRIPLIASWLIALLVVVAIATPNLAVANSAVNAQSSVGINLAPVTYYSSEQPFLNILKTAGAWTTHSAASWDTGEEKYLNLDSDGYPIALSVINDANTQQFTSVGVLLLRQLPSTPNGYYPAGQYVVLYSGQGTITYGGDATLISRSPGKDIFNVATPSPGGIDLRITSTDPNHTGNYIRNIQVVKSEYLANLNAGQLFNPTFLALLKNYRALRFMDWFNSNGTTLATWATRPVPSNAFWGTSAGVPLEVAIQLANAVAADAWLNIPIRADNDYITHMATLVLNQLNPSQRAYIEFSNEVWNSMFPQNAYAISQGQTAFPQALNKWYSGWEWYGVRVAQIGDIWFSIYGSSAFTSRVTVVMAGQGANIGVLKEELSTPDWVNAGNGAAYTHHIGAAAISMYFGALPSAASLTGWLSQADGGLTALFASLYAQTDPSVPSGGYLGQVTASYVLPHIAALKAYNLPLVGYEGGQSFQAYPTYADGSPQQNLLLAANSDARMGSAYTSYLNAWKANGGTLFMHYNDSSTWNKFGEWGALQSIMQTTTPLSSAPPKWQALENFIANNPCWWSGCGGTIGITATPMAPTNLSVK